MANDFSLPLLFPPRLPGRVVNERLVIHEEDGRRVAVVDGVPAHIWVVGDVMSENLFVVQARELQVATINELADALERPARTLHLAARTYRQSGAAALAPKQRGKPRTEGDLLRDEKIREMHGEGMFSRAITRALKTSPTTVKRALERMGLEPNVRRQQGLLIDPPACNSVAPPAAEDAAPPPAASPAEAEDLRNPVAPTTAAVEPRVLSSSLDPDPLHRVVDRLLASQGALYDAAPLFLSGTDLPYIGVLLGVPGIVQSGLLEEAQDVYGDIGPAFYGLRTTLLVVESLFLLRVKRAEGLKEVSPAELGRVFGLDRVPEVKTLRRKMREIAAGSYTDVLLSVSQRRMALADDAAAWMYVDGHVRVYSGKERLPKTHSARMRICLPATQDIWVHDGDGQPVLFVTQEAHPALTTVLQPIVEAAREATGRRELTVVFDRGGWSPELFAALQDDGVHVLTYRKGSFEAIPAEGFSAYPVPLGTAELLLHERSVRLPNGLWMREITRLVGEHQTSIVTTRQDLAAEVLAQRMFNRWRQENFFKYMRQEYDLDGLVEYGSEEEDPIRETPNPEWARRNKALKTAKGALRATESSDVARGNTNLKRATEKVSQLEERRRAAEAAGETGPRLYRKYRAALQAVEDRRVELEHWLTGARELEHQIETLKADRDAVPKRVMVGELDTPPVRLPARLKNLVDGLKMIAYQVETDLFNAVAPFYKRHGEDGRTLITSAMRSRGHLDVTATELVVTIAPQSSAHRSRAIAALCHVLNETETRFPGTELRLRYQVEGFEPPPMVPSSAM